MKERDGRILLHDTHMGIWEETVDEKSFHTVYGSVIRHLRTRGFKVFRCPETKKHYPILARKHHRGYKRNLRVKLNYSGRHLEIRFFQELNTVNPNGGLYDFDKYSKMSYLMKKQFILESSKLIEMLTETYGYGYTKALALAPARVSPVQRVLIAIAGLNPNTNPLDNFNYGWGANRFKRDETGWPVPEEYDQGGYNKDRDGVPLRNGMFRYFRDRDGRLKRGRIYTNMNNMWQVVCGPGKGDSHYMSSFNLFSLSTDDVRGRWFPDKYRKAKIHLALKKAVKALDYERAAVLRDILGLKVARAA